MYIIIFIIFNIIIISPASEQQRQRKNDIDKRDTNKMVKKESKIVVKSDGENGDMKKVLLMHSYCIAMH
jgi:hypothetical protein